MSYLNITLAAEDETFARRIRGVLYKLAGDVQNEDPATPDHQARVALANTIRRFLSFDTPRFAWLAASNPTIAASIMVDQTTGLVSVDAPDGDLEFVCSSYWTEVAKEVWGSPR